ncbi:hypothetical protein AAF712_016648 [Marasmius tenuissimus]|uniref:Uncharacterized protein n=1 Tax=Marasmius tenuissimus TaxID=585030 RepID=A0ABR2Z665_9AGAR
METRRLVANAPLTQVLHAQTNIGGSSNSQMRPGPSNTSHRKRKRTQLNDLSWPQSQQPPSVDPLEGVTMDVDDIQMGMEMREPEPEENASGLAVGRVDEDDEVDPGSLADLRLEEAHVAHAPSANTSSNLPQTPSLDLRNEDQPIPEDAPETFTPNFVPRLDDIKIALAFADALKSASLDSDLEPLDPSFLHRLRHPPTAPLKLQDRDERLSIELFMAHSRSSDEIYTETCEIIKRAFPDVNLLTLHEVKDRVSSITGVVPIWRDMCPNSCMGYTGPFHRLENCSFCGEERYRLRGRKKIARQQFPTIPVALMLQALNRTAEGADAMDYRTKYTEQLLRQL